MSLVRASYGAAWVLLVTVTSATADASVTVPAPAGGWGPTLDNAVNVILLAAATAVASVITAVGVKLAKKLGLEASAQDQANMEHEITAALNVGITKILPMIRAEGWSSTSVHDAILTTAADYLRQRFPDRAAKITAAAQPSNASYPQISSTTALTETLAARLPAAALFAAQSPATPPLPPDPLARNHP